MYLVEGTSIDDLWINAIKAITKDGEKLSGIQEIPNLAMRLEGKFEASKKFDTAFRKAFGDERIDYASSVTFVPPTKSKLTGAYVYKQNDPSAKWTNSYWGRMIAFSGKVNQIEAAIKKLSNGKNTKMISIAVYDPVSDSKKVMGGVPCMTSMDIKPRNRKLDVTAFFRSMRLSKSGYADMKALCDLSSYIAERSATTVGSLTLIATSGHIFYSGDEWANTEKLLKYVCK